LPAVSTKLGKKTIDLCNNTRQTIVSSILCIDSSSAVINGNNPLVKTLKTHAWQPPEAARVYALIWSNVGSLFTFGSLC
jgi:hypothetical protein